MDILEPIRLIVWDLDETFWHGTLTEGGIEAFVQEHHDLVHELARRGIMSSICSKNDHDAVRAILQEHGLWDSFIFPSIDWSPKGARIAAMVEAIGLRPSTVMFIDDNPNNRGEVAASVPGIVVADETFIAAIAAHPMFKGKADDGLTRLAQYKLLERKKQDEVQALGDNTGFLRGCAIRVTIEHDLERHLDRVIELINRTNQLNFTKLRLPDEPAEARAEALKQLRYFGHQGALVRVSDRYGDYGFVGFYLKTLDEGIEAGTLKHFCFSCRTIGMGVEQWVYQTLGRPWLTVVGDVLADVFNAPPVDWINQAGSAGISGRRLSQFVDIRLRGGCEISAMAHYFKVAGPVTCVETNFGRDIFVNKLDTGASLVNALEATPEQKASLERLALSLRAWRQASSLRWKAPLCSCSISGASCIFPSTGIMRAGSASTWSSTAFMSWTEAHQGRAVLRMDRRGTGCASRCRRAEPGSACANDGHGGRIACQLHVLRPRGGGAGQGQPPRHC